MKVAIYRCKQNVFVTTDAAGNEETHKISFPSKYLAKYALNDLKKKKIRDEIHSKYGTDLSADEHLCYTLLSNSKHINSFIKKKPSFNNNQLNLFAKAVLPFYDMRNLE